MNTSQMRHIDYYFGGAVCLLLDAVERIRRLFSRQRTRPEPKTVLVTKYLGMGSILLATPALKALKTRYPASRIILLTFSSNTAFAQRLQLFDDVLSIRTSSLMSFTVDTLRNLRIIRQLKVDYLLDFEFFARFSTIVSYLSGAACRVGYYMPQIWRGDLLDIPVHFNPYRHVSEIFSAQVEALGISVVDTTITAPHIDDVALAKVRRTLQEAGVQEVDSVITVNVNASDLSLERRWPSHHFVTLIDALARHPNVCFVLVGSPGEKLYVEEVYSALSPATRDCCINLAGEQTLDEFIALLALSDACITNDSGPLHIAAALGTRTISFFGPESPQLYGPKGEGHIVFYAGIYCSPCLSVFNAKRAMCNGNNICMKAILPDQVLEELSRDTARPHE
jgi:ADP-heptose:LPS heptosyltransferase